MTVRLKVDPIACEAHGLCAELFPERVTLDEWGYPLIEGDPVPAALLEHARRAAAACPTLALRLESRDDARSLDERFAPARLRRT